MIKNNIFYEEELQKLPLFYRKMDKMQTDDVKELYKGEIFTQSYLHQSESYRQVIPTIPFSNLVISYE